MKFMWNYLKLQSSESLGSDASSVQEKAPWLPGAVLYLGKCPGNLYDFSKCIIAQVNTMLLEEINLPREDQERNMSDEYGDDGEDKEAKEEKVKKSTEKQNSKQNVSKRSDSKKI